MLDKLDLGLQQHDLRRDDHSLPPDMMALWARFPTGAVTSAQSTKK